MIFTLVSHIPRAPQRILCGPQEIKNNNANTIKNVFFILLIYNFLHIFQLFQIIPMV